MSAAPLLDVVGEIRRPTLFIPGFPARDPVEFTSLPQVAERIRKLAAHKAVTITRCRAAHPDYPDGGGFPGLSVKLDGLWIALIGGPWRTEAALAEVQDELRGLT